MGHAVVDDHAETEVEAEVSATAIDRSRVIIQGNLQALAHSRAPRQHDCKKRARRSSRYARDSLQALPFGEANERSRTRLVQIRSRWRRRARSRISSTSRLLQSSSDTDRSTIQLAKLGRPGFYRAHPARRGAPARGFHVRATSLRGRSCGMQPAIDAFAARALVDCYA